MFQDEILVCRDCGGKFVYSGEEQAFYAEMERLPALPREDEERPL